jgi:hypothetical protein
VPLHAVTASQFSTYSMKFVRACVELAAAMVAYVLVLVLVLVQGEPRNITTWIAVHSCYKRRTGSSLPPAEDAPRSAAPSCQGLDVYNLPPDSSSETILGESQLSSINRRLPMHSAWRIVQHTRSCHRVRTSILLVRPALVRTTRLLLAASGSAYTTTSWISM